MTKGCLSLDVQNCCATSGDGLLEGMGWVKTQLRTSNKHTKGGNAQAGPASDSEVGDQKERSRLQSSWISFSNYLTRGGGTNTTETYQRL